MEALRKQCFLILRCDPRERQFIVFRGNRTAGAIPERSEGGEVRPGVVIKTRAQAKFLITNSGIITRGIKNMILKQAGIPLSRVRVGSDFESEVSKIFA